MTLFSLEITFEDLWIDFCDFGEADFVGLWTSRSGGWSFCGSAGKIYLKLVLAGILGIRED
jgi:cellobiose phosphorylase